MSEMTDEETLQACCKLMAKIFSKQEIDLRDYQDLYSRLL